MKVGAMIAVVAAVAIVGAAIPTAHAQGPMTGRWIFSLVVVNGNVQDE